MQSGVRLGSLGSILLILLTLPWLANPLLGFHGPIVGFTGWVWAWVAICGVCFIRALEKSKGFSFVWVWAFSLSVAAVLSALIAAWQYFGFAVEGSCCVASSASHVAYGNLKQRNQLATLLGLGLLALIYGLQTCAAHQTKRRWLWGGVFAAALLSFAHALTASRIGAVEWFCAGVLLFVWRKSLRFETKAVYGFALLCFGAAVLLLPNVAAWAGHSNTGLLGRSADSAAFSRIPLWSNMLELIAAKPWAGWGWKELAFAHYSSVFRGERSTEFLDHAHNLPLHLAVELGLPVALLLCVLSLWLIWRAKPWSETRPERQLAWGALLLMGLHSMVEYPLWYGPFFLTLLLSLAVLVQNYVLKRLKLTAEYAQTALIFIAILGWGAAAFLVWDYKQMSQIYLSSKDRSSWLGDDPMQAAQKSWFFKGHVQFAQLMSAELTQSNAQEQLDLALKVLHFSPEPRVIEKLLDAALVLRRDDLLNFHLPRYKIIDAQAYAAWRSAQSPLNLE